MRLIALLLFCVFGLSGCDPVSDIVDAIAEIFSTYLPSVGCWVLSMVASAVNLMGEGISTLLSPFISLLPEYTVPSVDLASIEFIGYAAYFFPISEAATLIIYVLQFWLGFWTLRAVMRWVKLWS